jgi:magnesium-transporting ATPase (P-type)
VDESALTGEAKEVHKFTKDEADKVEDEGEKLTSPYCIYKGTDVKTGRAKGVVFATGMQTKVGLIAKRLIDDPEEEDEFGNDDKKNHELGKGNIRLNPLQVSVNKLGLVIATCCGIVITIASAAGFLLGYQSVPPVCSQTDWGCLLYTCSIRGLLMAIAIIPHGLPLVVMIMLRLASSFMLEKNAMVCKQSAVDYLGATHVICTDKTGTLTAGVMAVKQFVGILRTPEKAAEDVAISFYPLEGLDPKGGAFSSNKLTEGLEREVNQGADIDKLQNCPNLSDPTKEAPQGCKTSALVSHVGLAAAYVHCYGCKIMPPAVGEDKWKSQGSTSEAALKVAAWKGTKGRLVDKESGELSKLRFGNPENDKLQRQVTPPSVQDDFPGEALKEQFENLKDLEIPFNSDRKMAATVHKLPEGDRYIGHGQYKLRFKDEFTHVCIVKGAPDRIWGNITGMLTEQDGALAIADGKATEDEIAHIKEMNETLGSRALRSILMAIRPLTEKDFNDLESETNADARLKFLLDEGRDGPMTLLGLWGIYDPPRATVPGSVAAAHAAFIRVVMITGDQMVTAKAIARKVGIVEDSTEGETHVLPCKELHHEDPVLVRQQTVEALQKGTSKAELKEKRGLHVHDMKSGNDEHESEYKDTEELVKLTRETHVWSRAEPTDKFTIVESLQHQNYKVAMTGDGVNDAPALKKADVGVAMGIAGTQVTKKAASLVLLDDNFSTILKAVQEGRKIYGNVQKYVVFNLAVKGSECLCCMVAIFYNLPLPIQGLPQLVNLLVTQIIPPVCIAWEDQEEYTMKIPPRKTDGDLILDRVFMFYRWAPFLIMYAIVIMPSMCLYTWLNIGYVNVRTIVGSHEYLAVQHNNAACQVAGQMIKGEFYADKEPFHCKCYMRDNYWDDNPKVNEQWGLFDNSGVEMDRWTGDTGTSYLQASTPWAGGRKTYVHKCKDELGHSRLCWNNPKAPKPLLDAGKNCAAFGARKATTMSYVSIQIGEMLCLATFRTDGPVWFARMSQSYNGMLVFNLLVLVVVLSIPWVTEILTFQPLERDDFLLALIAPVFMVLGAELTKVLFRNRLAAQNDEKRKIEMENDIWQSGIPSIENAAEDTADNKKAEP